MSSQYAAGSDEQHDRPGQVGGDHQRALVRGGGRPSVPMNSEARFGSQTAAVRKPTWLGEAFEQGDGDQRQGEFA